MGDTKQQAEAKVVSGWRAFEAALLKKAREANVGGGLDAAISWFAHQWAVSETYVRWCLLARDRITSEGSSLLDPEKLAEIIKSLEEYCKWLRRPLQP